MQQSNSLPPMPHRPHVLDGGPRRGVHPVTALMLASAAAGCALLAATSLLQARTQTPTPAQRHAAAAVVTKAGVTKTAPTNENIARRPPAAPALAPAPAPADDNAAAMQP